MATPAGYKPSPLGYGSPRSSPFRRPESPVSPSPLRQAGPTSPFKGASTPTGGSRMMGSATTLTPGPTNASWTPRNTTSGNGSSASNAHAHSTLQTAAEIQAAGPRSPAAAAQAGLAPPSMMAQGSALSQLQPAQVRTLREGFQILDRDGNGMVGREDVADMLNQLGLPASPSDIARFFPPAAPQTMAMGTFLNTLAAALAALSPSTELLSALSAFDEDDSGQIDVAELRDALLHTAPEPGEPALTEAEIHRVMQGFVGRRAFSTSAAHKGGSGGFGGKRGEVFRYQEFVQSIAGSGQGAAEEAAEA